MSQGAVPITGVPRRAVSGHRCVLNLCVRVINSLQSYLRLVSLLSKIQQAMLEEKPGDVY